MNKARRQTTNQVPAAGESSISHAMYSLNIRFTATPSRQLQIKNTMQTSAKIQDKKIIPSLFQVAAQIEDPSSAVSVKPATSLNETPLADLMLHPEKVATVLEVTKIGDRGTRQGSLKRATQTAAAINTAVAGENLPTIHRSKQNFNSKRRWPVRSNSPQILPIGKNLPLI